jgi:hypothetical protein
MSGVLEHSFAELLVDICVAGAALGSFYHLTAIILVLRFPRARKVPPAPFPAVTITRKRAWSVWPHRIAVPAGLSRPRGRHLRGTAGE